MVFQKSVKGGIRECVLTHIMCTMYVAPEQQVSGTGTVTVPITIVY